MRMAQLARAAALSSSATTRLVNRLEDRGLLTRILCADDRRGIYTELTPAGRELLESARPTHEATPAAALDEACKTGRAHVWTPVTNAHIVCPHTLEKK